MRALPFVALTALIVGCGSSASATRAATAAPTVPATDADPLPHRADAEPIGETNGEVALTITGGEEHALRLTIGLIEALRDGDAQRLDLLMGDDLIDLQVSGRRRTLPRSQRLARIILFAQRRTLPTDASAAEFVDIEGAIVQRAIERWPENLPEDLLPDDLVVMLRIHERAAPALRLILRWTGVGLLVVRGGSEPRIIAL